MSIEMGETKVPREPNAASTAALCAKALFLPNLLQTFYCSPHTFPGSS